MTNCKKCKFNNGDGCNALGNLFKNGDGCYLQPREGDKLFKLNNKIIWYKSQKQKKYDQEFFDKMTERDFYIRHLKSKYEV